MRQVKAAGGAGGVLGAVLARLIGKQHADLLQEQLARGGIRLWARTTDETREKRTREIPNKQFADGMHIPDLSVPAVESGSKA